MVTLSRSDVLQAVSDLLVKQDCISITKVWTPKKTILVCPSVHTFKKLLKCLVWILAFSTNFCPIDIDLSGNTVWPQASVFQKLTKMNIFGLFNILLSTQNVNVARFVFNVEWGFFCDFQTLCYGFSINLKDCFNCEIVITMIRSLETWLSIGLLIVFKPFRPPSCFQCHTIC